MDANQLVVNSWLGVFGGLDSRLDPLMKKGCCLAVSVESQTTGPKPQIYHYIVDANGDGEKNASVIRLIEAIRLGG